MTDHIDSNTNTPNYAPMDDGACVLGKQTFMYSMKEAEKFELANGLQKYHSIFKKFWQIATIVFTDDLPTAAVCGRPDSDEVILMKINPTFWAELTPVQRLWVICHECMHAILEHFTRGQNLEYPGMANKMMDIVINHMTVERFGFKRSEIDPDNRFCWLDRFFKPEDNVRPGMHFEYYYAEMLKYPERWQIGNLLDHHLPGGGGAGGVGGFMKKMNSELSPEEKAELEDALSKHAGSTTWKFEDIKVKKKKKWEKIIKNWVLKTIGYRQKDDTQWVHEDRRLNMLPRNLSFPYAKPKDEAIKEKDKIDLYFFLDASGSCLSYGERFFRATKSIPQEKFNVYYYSFDTAIYEVDMEKREIQGGGGTDFQIMENYIQAKIKESTYDKKYPGAVWVITDGGAGMPTLEKPENWHWFMTEDHTTHSIPKDCNIYMLKDYE